MKNLKITKELREELKKPFGKLVKEIDLIPIKGKTVISVGDEVTENLLKKNFTPKLCIYDKKTKRKTTKTEEIEKFNAPEFKVKNPQGTIKKEAQETIKKALKLEYSKILVEGEEDLLVIPVLKYAPNNSIVIYGQPDEGVIYIEVNPEKKHEIKNIMKKFNEDNE